VHVKSLQRAEVTESLEDSKEKLRRDSVFICAQARTHDCGAHRKTKVEAFENLEKFFQAWKKALEAQEGAQLSDLPKEIWTI
jgi:predicted RNase H-like HicB family nuclease